MSDARDFCRLLRPRRERPCPRRRDAEQRGECAAFLIELHSIPANQRTSSKETSVLFRSHTR